MGRGIRSLQDRGLAGGAAGGVAEIIGSFSQTDQGNFSADLSGIDIQRGDILFSVVTDQEGNSLINGFDFSFIDTSEITQRQSFLVLTGNETTISIQEATVEIASSAVIRGAVPAAALSAISATPPAASVKKGDIVIISTFRYDRNTLYTPPAGYSLIHRGVANGGRDNAAAYAFKIATADGTETPGSFGGSRSTTTVFAKI